MEYKGAMPEALLMKEAALPLFREYQEAAGGHITYLTLSPEIPGAVEIVPGLRGLGITVAMGHSAAGYDVSWAAVKAGLTAATHLGNAERLFHRHLGRRPGERLLGGGHLRWSSPSPGDGAALP